MSSAAAADPAASSSSSSSSPSPSTPAFPFVSPSSLSPFAQNAIEAAIKLAQKHYGGDQR